MRLRLVGICAFLFCFSLMARQAWADGIPVQNGSFEITNPLTTPCGPGCAYNLGPIPDWTTVSGQTGSWQPNSSFYNLPLPNGNIVAFTNPGQISQDLGVTLNPDTSYTLSVYVGHRLDGLTGDYTIALDVGATTMCNFLGSSTTITAGSFAQETCSFETGASVPSGDLTILLGNSTGQANFDNVTVTSPEPSAAILLAAGLTGLALFVIFSRRKQTIQGRAS